MAAGGAGSALRLGLAALAVAVLLVGVLPLLAPHDPHRVAFAARLLAPGPEYPLGTDHLGRCVLSRLIHGFRVTPLAALAVVVTALGAGTAVGLAAGSIGGAFDRVVMRVVEGIQILPGLALALIIAGVFGLGLWTVVLALAAVHWTEYARLARTMTLAERAKPYVLGAEALGAPRHRVVLRHVLPNIAAPILVLGTVSLSWAILSFAGLSFLGLGAEPGSTEWGLMIAEARNHMRLHPRLVLAPGLTIVALVIAVNLLGDALQDRAAAGSAGTAHRFVTGKGRTS
ncbi:ABC transporter permease [Azospirillum halopraeferens]|uniref:ABC transporter permease n=1 Tax=Azospirillum halopraeferens TaxID=34010 RepID=UPI0003F732BA|nr:ABC transporter permease [Azospirillum halopraeferens]